MKTMTAVVTATTAVGLVLVGGCSAATSPAPTPTTAPAGQSYKQCFDEVMAGSNVCAITTDDEHAGTNLVSARSKDQCELYRTDKSTPAICVVTEGADRGATWPITY